MISEKFATELGVPFHSWISFDVRCAGNLIRVFDFANWEGCLLLGYFYIKKICIYSLVCVFIWLSWVLVAACKLLTVACGLSWRVRASSLTRERSQPPALGTHSPRHWVTRAVPCMFLHFMSDPTPLVFLHSVRSPGEGNGNLLQYSCLENPVDKGVWWTTVHGVSKSRTRLSDFTFTFHQKRPA